MVLESQKNIKDTCYYYYFISNIPVTWYVMAATPTGTNKNSHCIDSLLLAPLECTYQIPELGQYMAGWCCTSLHLF